MKKFLSLLLCAGLTIPALCQESAANEEIAAPKQTFARATFNSTKLINMQTTELVSPGSLQFMISHHFSYLWNKDAGSQNLAQLFGLNSGVAHTYLSFDYSPTSYLNLGVAAAGYSKYEGCAKIKLLRQQTGLKNMPVAVALYTMFNVNTCLLYTSRCV